MARKQVFSALLLLGCCAALGLAQAVGQVDMNKNVGLELSKVNVKTKLFATIEPVFTILSSDLSKGQTQAVVLDLGYDRVLVPDRSRGGGFGIDCTADKSCSAVGTQYNCAQYNGVTPQCVDATSFFRFNEMSLKDKNVNLLSFQLIQSSSGWSDVIGTNGVLGLSPKSSFWPFVNVAYNKPKNQDYLDFSLHYKVKDSHYTFDFQKLDIKDSQFIANGRYTSTDTAFADADLKTYPAQWVIPKVTAKFSKTDDGRKDVPACIDNTVHQFFLVPDADYEGLTQGINTQLCKKKDGCKRGESNAANVDNIVVTFASDSKAQDITLTARDFIFYDSNDNAIIGIGKQSDSTACAAVPNGIVLARLFFTQAELTLRSKSATSFRIGISKINLPTTAFYVVILVVLVSLILAILLAIFLVRSCRKNSRDTAEQKEKFISGE
jgi:hypothetical protein